MAEIIIPRRGERLLDENGQPTLRFSNWIELISQQTNNTTDDVEQAAFVSSFSAQLQQTVKELDGLPEFTIDTTGFTTDTTFITTDKVIA